MKVMNVLGVKITGHDTGAALIAGGRVVAIAEERLNRVKHSHNMFPRLSIDHCLKASGVKDDEVDLIVIDQIHEPDRFRMAETFRREMGPRFAGKRIEVVNHHLAHGANAFFCSPFKKAAVAIYDGSGEAFRSPQGVTVTETETYFLGQDGTLTELQKNLHARFARRFLYSCGIGRLYTAITYYLNFGHYEEGKTMGLAPYGKPDAFKEAPEALWSKEWHGQHLCNANISYPDGDYAGATKTRIHWRVWHGARGRLRRLFLFALERLGGESVYADPKLFPKLKFSKPPRPKDVKLPDGYYTDIAYAVQAVLEQVVTSIASRLRIMTGAEYLCISGGVGLNSVANKKILDQCGYKDIWVQPACSDSGVALGCALFGYHSILGQPRSWVMDHAYLGGEYSLEEQRAAIEAAGDRVSYRVMSDTPGETAKLLADGKIVGWFQGGSEYGPRALGHRSILVDARIPDMKDILNDRVKHREGWRPFAASVLAERAGDYFDLDRESPFMLLVCDVRDSKRGLIPSVVHVDDTCRVQTVTKEANGIYYDLIKAFGDLTGDPLVLNTSFNLAGEPIVETPADAVKDLLATNLDYLVIGDFLVSKKS